MDDETLAWFVLYVTAVVIVAWLVALLWKAILAGLLLWGLVKLATSEWHESEFRRQREHRRRLAAIDRIRRDTVAAMIDETRRVRR